MFKVLDRVGLGLLPRLAVYGPPPPGDGLHVGGCFRRRPPPPPIGRRPFPLRTRGIILLIHMGQSSWSGGWRVRLWTDRSAFRICLVAEQFDSPPPP